AVIDTKAPKAKSDVAVPEPGKKFKVPQVVSAIKSSFKKEYLKKKISNKKLAEDRATLRDIIANPDKFFNSKDKKAGVALSKVLLKRLAKNEVDKNKTKSDKNGKEKKSNITDKKTTKSKPTEKTIVKKQIDETNVTEEISGLKSELKTIISNVKEDKPKEKNKAKKRGRPTNKIQRGVYPQRHNLHTDDIKTKSRDAAERIEDGSVQINEQTQKELRKILSDHTRLVRNGHRPYLSDYQLKKIATIMKNDDERTFYNKYGKLRRETENAIKGVKKKTTKYRISTVNTKDEVLEEANTLLSSFNKLNTVTDKYVEFKKISNLIKKLLSRSSEVNIRLPKDTKDKLNRALKTTVWVRVRRLTNKKLALELAEAKGEYKKLLEEEVSRREKEAESRRKPPGASVWDDKKQTQYAKKKYLQLKREYVARVSDLLLNR
ncbi:MAG: hypothetical protein Q9M37_08475, partial [Desulfonauticus sp.]|nr:hypothetical protein [Desulfonauticus sp.]